MQARKKGEEENGAGPEERKRRKAAPDSPLSLRERVRVRGKSATLPNARNPGSNRTASLQSFSYDSAARTAAGRAAAMKVAASPGARGRGDWRPLSVARNRRAETAGSLWRTKSSPWPARSTSERNLLCGQFAARANKNLLSGLTAIPYANRG